MTLHSASSNIIVQKNPIPPNSKPPHQAATNINTKPPLLPTPSKIPPLRKLSPPEIQFRREHRLCFTCDEKFSPGHKCFAKHYFLIQSVEEVLDDMDNPNTSSMKPTVDSSNQCQITKPLHLSYNALTGIPTRRSIRFSRRVHGRDIRILIDGGSSYNFIHPALVKRLVVPF